MAILFLEAGGAATRGFEFWDSTSGTVTIDSTVTRGRTNDRSIKFGNATATVFKTVAWNRMSWWHRIDALPAVGTFQTIASGSAGLVFSTDGTGAIRAAGFSGTPVTGAAGAIVLTTFTRLSIAISLTNTTTFTVKVFVNGTLYLTATGADFTLLSVPTTAFAMHGSAAITTAYISDVYADDDTSTNDPVGAGVDLSVTPRFAAALNTNNFDTLGGSGTNRYDRVSDRPLSETNYIHHAASTDVQENFGLQAASAGDVNTTGATLIGYGGWAWAKRSALGVAIALRGAAVVPVGGSANPTTTVGLTIPATCAADDIVVVAVTSRDSVAAGTLAVTDNEGAGSWTKGANSTDHKATIWWKRASGATGGTTMTVSNAVGSLSCVMKVFSGCITTGSPFADVVVESNISGNETHATFTPTNGDSLLVGTVHNYANDNAVTTLAFATAGALTATEHLSTGGSDSGCIFGHLVQTAGPSSTGAMTWAQTDGTTYSITLALVPQTPVSTQTAGTPKIMVNGTETAVTLTASAAFYAAYTTAGTYPSNVAGIGMRSSNGGCDTYYYEGGVLVAYTPGATPFQLLPLYLNQAVNRASTY